jgi:ribosome maturation factor RimP
MAANTTDTPMVQRIRSIVEPIASDLGLDLYDIEQRGGTMRVTLDTPPGGPAGIDLDQLALATRLVSRELDHQDPIPGHYTLEVTSPGVERSLRIPAHFQREIGKIINVRLANVDADQRRFEGQLIAADDSSATIRVGEGDGAVEHVIEIDSIDRARTVFVWGPQPKPGAKKPGAKKAGAKKPGAKKAGAKKAGASAAPKKSQKKKESS